MHSWASSLRKTEARIRVFAARGSVVTRSLFTEPNRSSLVGPSRRFDGNDSSFLDSFLRSISYGVVVAGSSLGLYFCSPFCGGASFLSYADSGETEKKSAFLFTGIYMDVTEEFHAWPNSKDALLISAKSHCFLVFEYFASFKSPSGEAYMTASDLMRAVVPVFPPSEADAVRGGYLKGELITSELHCPPSEFFMLFDTNNDGLISFPYFVSIAEIYAEA